MFTITNNGEKAVGIPGGMLAAGESAVVELTEEEKAIFEGIDWVEVKTKRKPKKKEDG